MKLEIRAVTAAKNMLSLNPDIETIVKNVDAIKIAIEINEEFGKPINAKMEHISHILSLENLE